MSNEPASSPVNDAPSADGQPGDLCGGQGLSRRSLLMGGAALALTAGQPLSAATAACQTQARVQPVDVQPQTQVQEKGVRPQTFADGNLYIPRAIRELHVTPLTGIVLRETALKDLFRQAKVPCQLLGEYSKGNSVNFKYYGNVTFGDHLSLLLSNHRNCRVENGVYIVYPLEKINIILGRPDLDRRWFKRKTEREAELRPFLDGLFAEAGLQHQVRDDVGKYFGGIDMEIDFRSAIHDVVGAVFPPATFEVRDGVYCFYPRPTY